MPKFDYEQAWKQVNENENNGLPETALKVVNDIYAHAKSEENAPQLVKAITHQLKFIDYKEEDSFTKNMQKLKDEIEHSSFPVKPLLHSMIAEMYWQYYQSNRDIFTNRSATVNLDLNDITTWSLNKIAEETFLHYTLSLQDAEKSKALSINFYDEITKGSNEAGRKLRPTLYDFLAHRALQFFGGTEPDITKPAYFFTISDPVYFTDRPFTKLPLISQDSSSMKLKALQIYQDLENFHTERKEIDALVTVKIERAEFVYRYGTMPEKDSLYLDALEELSKNYARSPVSTDAIYLMAQYYSNQATKYRPLVSDSHKWDYKKSLDICEQGIKRFPDSNGGINCEALKKSILSKSITAEIEENNLPGQAFRSLIQYKNITTIHYRIVKITRKEVRDLRKKLDKEYHSDREREFIKHFVAKPFIKHGKYDLPSDGDHQTHSIEIKLDAIPVGEYMILYSHQPNFSLDENGIAYNFTVVTNLSFIHRAISNGSTEFFLLHRETGDPIKNVKAEVTKLVYKNGNYEKVHKGTFTSDAQGHLVVPEMIDDHGSNFTVEFTLNDDFVSSESIDNIYYSGNLYQYVNQKQHSTIRTSFFLDRAIYRPGQTIYFKGLVYESDGKSSSIKKNYTSTVQLFDVNYQPKGELTLTTNEFGTFDGSFTAPAGGLTGQMHLQTTDNTGSVYFSVEEYKRPKFEVSFEEIKGVFKVNDTITTEGIAKAYSGANIDGAMVKYRVTRTASFPFWIWCLRGYYPPSPAMEITNGETITDENGKFSISFPAIPDLSVNKDTDPTFNYSISVDVTDINGETHSATNWLDVSYKALNINLRIATPINLDSAKQLTYHVLSTNMAGTFEPAKGEVKIWKLKSPDKAFRTRLWPQPDRHLYSKEEYYKLFPHDLYADETNKYKWEREKEVFTASFDTQEKKEYIVDGINKWGIGEYVAEISSTDKYGQEVKEIKYFQLFAPSVKPVTPQVHYFTPIKTYGEPGETASFYFGTSNNRISALYELEYDGEILKQERVVLKDEQKYFTVPILESYRGNAAIHYTFIRNNRIYKETAVITVPYTNKELDITFESFRNKLLPGAQEEWKIKIKAKKAEKITAEMVATLYDQSLDEFQSNNWYVSIYNQLYGSRQWMTSNDFIATNFRLFTNNWNDYNSRSIHDIGFDELNWFGYSFYYYGGRVYKRKAMLRSGLANVEEADDMVMMEAAPSAAKKSAEAPGERMRDSENSEPPSQGGPAKPEQNKTEEDLGEIQTRKNFNETAFFYPHLMTNENGEVIIKFTIPEALTRWKMLGFAHTQDLKYGFAYNQLVTQKELMVVPNQPRFFRENDKMIFTAKISSLVEKSLSGTAQLEFFDALTMKPIQILGNHESRQKSFELKPNQSTTVEWSIAIPEGAQAITYRIVAKAGEFSDGEEMVIPVVTNRMLVTETLPLPIRGNQTKDFTFKKLLENKSNTLRHQRYTLEFTSNPAWYAVQALPYLMEYPYECTEQLFSRFYANSIASHIANSNPKIKRVFDTWKNIQPDALLSNLEKNQELKSALLEETPWVLNAQDESQRKRMIGVLFDLNRMANEQQRALEKIQRAQLPSGGFSWFPGFPEDRYMTQHIIAGMGHLDVMGVKSVRAEETWSMITNAVPYLDHAIKNDYDELVRLSKEGKIKLEDNNISYVHFHYLYMRSYFKDIKIPDECQKAFDYFLGQAKKYWLKYNLYMEGMACLALNRYGDKTTPQAMLKSFNERALHSDEMGMYWKNDHGYYWYLAPVETHSLMIEVYEEVAGDTKAVEALKVWLLKQKQTQDWNTTKATAEACYALLRRGTDLLASDNLVEIKIGNQVIDPKKREDIKVEAGTGYFKTAWTASEITSNMGNIHISKKDEGVAWGAVYWQYFEQLDKITPAETPLKLKKQLFIQRQTDRGPVIEPVSEANPLKIGDLVKVRLEIRIDRNLEYVHIKDMRASSFEPVSTISTYKYQDGLYYYESPRDLSTNFFVGYMDKGTYVFEYDLRVSQRGDFSNGITTIQCMYAPEFTSHSEGIRVQVK